MTDNEVLFENIALVGPALFFSLAYSSEELAGRFAAPGRAHDRDYVVLRTLAEVQKSGLARRRWREEETRAIGNNRTDLLIRESLDVERAAWQRRLLEALVCLINFSNTNEEVYYTHFLSIYECERSRSRVLDELNFFGTESEITKHELAEAKAKVDAVAKQLPLHANAWYVKPEQRYQLAPLHTRYKQALALALPGEQTALGYSYDLSFGAASERLHFSVLGPRREDDDSGKCAAALCGLLSFAIICRAHDLCGVEPRGVNRQLMKPEIRQRPISFLLRNRAEIGDFVLCPGPRLGEVLEVRSGAYGYKRYRLKFFDKGLVPDVQEDWLPALAIRPYMNRGEIVEAAKKALAEDGVSDASLNEEDFKQAARDAILETWNRGMREYFTRIVHQMKGL